MVPAINTLVYAKKVSMNERINEKRYSVTTNAITSAWNAWDFLVTCVKKDIVTVSFDFLKLNGFLKRDCLHGQSPIFALSVLSVVQMYVYKVWLISLIMTTLKVELMMFEKESIVSDKIIFEASWFIVIGYSPLLPVSYIYNPWY